MLFLLILTLTQSQGKADYAEVFYLIEPKEGIVHG